ncbi:DNA repair protein RecO [Fictibacillus macauensis ZFHKF-1]|uniref:DNA repair protein RecO n=1 Tax=Fictibacillus macauensis ZFHKF-1 TaxID=1196324 RepID=I8UEG8_9BACL|nr:DNA repair protein RecO [Fictibacillus macauensis]EIT85208.1 DNA repair protein RecO [Fictibacillus macauensis ZFHKF-1]
MLQKVEGIVIRKVDYGESNVILTLFTRENGKIGVMARGAKKPKSRLSSVAQLFTYGYFVYQKNRGLGSLNQGEIIDSFRGIKEDLFKTAYCAYMVEFLDKVTEENGPNPYLFEHLHQSFHLLDEGVDPEVILSIFEMKMLVQAGIGPQVNRCVHCGRTEGTFSFSMREGGFLCERCLAIDPNVLPLTPAAARLLHLFYHFDLQRLGNVTLKQSTKDEIRTVLSMYIEEFSGIYFKSKKFLNQLSKFQ